MALTLLIKGRGRFSEEKLRKRLLSWGHGSRRGQRQNDMIMRAASKAAVTEPRNTHQEQKSFAELFYRKATSFLPLH
jgi:hypothetical protein